MHKYKSQVIQSMQEGNKLRFVIKSYMRNINYSNIILHVAINLSVLFYSSFPSFVFTKIFTYTSNISVLVKQGGPLAYI